MSQEPTHVYVTPTFSEDRVGNLQADLDYEVTGPKLYPHDLAGRTARIVEADDDRIVLEVLP